jgi:hypothetical protein
MALHLAQTRFPAAITTAVEYQAGAPRRAVAVVLARGLSGLTGTNSIDTDRYNAAASGWTILNAGAGTYAVGTFPGFAGVAADTAVGAIGCQADALLATLLLASSALLAPFAALFGHSDITREPGQQGSDAGSQRASQSDPPRGSNSLIQDIETVGIHILSPGGANEAMHRRSTQLMWN